MRDATVAVRTTAVLWTVGVTAVLAGMPFVVRERLPDRLATHWGLGSEVADGSMPLWAASLVPALLWLVTAAGATVPLAPSDARPVVLAEATRLAAAVAR